jgi:hypothetical protein
MVNPLLVIEKEECNGQKYMCCIGIFPPKLKDTLLDNELMKE